MASNHLLATALLLLSLFREAASKVPSAPYNLQGSPLFTPGQGGGGPGVFLQLTWDSEYEMPDSTVVAEYMVYYRAVSEVGSSPVRLIRAFGADAMLSTEMGLTYEAWVTSVAMTGEESQPSISVTIDIDYLQSVATAHLPDGIHFTCTFAQVYFTIGCSIILRAHSANDTFHYIGANATSSGPFEHPVAMGIVATTDSGLWYTYSATAVQWSDRQGLQHGVKLVGVVSPLGYSGSTLPYTVDFLVLIILLVLGVVLLVPLLLVLVALCHCWTRRQFRRKKYVHHIGSLDELSVIFKTTPSGLHPLPYGYLPTTAVVADIQKSQYDTVTPDLPPSRSGTLRSAFSGYHSRQMSGSDFLNALSLTDVESVGNSVDLSSVQQKKSRRLSFKRSFPFLNITTYEDAERSETLKKAYSYDTGLDAEMALAGKQSEDAVSLRTSLYNILDDFDSRWNIDGVNTSDVSADDM